MSAAGSAPYVAPHAVPTLYRQLIKLYIRKFGNDHEVIVRAWRQTKTEFYHYRGAAPEDVPVLVERGREIYKSLAGGIVPVRVNAQTGKPYVHIDKETFEASDGKVEPVSHEEALRRSHKAFSKEELRELQGHLINVGRWHGKLEFDRVPNLKKKKVKYDLNDPSLPAYHRRRLLRQRKSRKKRSPPRPPLPRPPLWIL